MKININEKIEFELTDTGLDILRKYYADKVYQPKCTHKQKMSIWEFARIFGNSFSPVNTYKSQVVKENTISVENK